MSKWIRRLHGDERGDVVQVVIIVALIVIPLALVLIFFGDKIQSWLSDSFNELMGKKGDIKKTL